MRLKAACVRCVLTALFLMIALVGIEFQSVAEINQPFGSRQEFLSATGSMVSKRLNATPLNPQKPLDQKVLKLIEELDALNEMKNRVFWADGHGAHAHPEAGIGLDRIQLRQWEDELKTDKFEEIIRFILAHEQAHMLQYQIYSRESILDKNKLRAVECQADVLGGMSVINALLMKGPAVSYGNDAIKQWSEFSYRIGFPAWDDQTKHPQPEQRMRAVSLGLNAGMHNRDVQIYKRTRDPKLLEQIKFYRSRTPDLFDIDEDIFDWSNHICKKIVQYNN